jgi:ABC-2 type transport system permease protein
LSALIEIYAQQFRTTFAVMLQYRASLVIWMIGHILEPIVYLVVWSTVSISHGDSVGGYSTAEFATYFIVLMIVNHITFSWIMWEYEYRVRQGILSFALLKPVHPIHSDVADNVAYKLITLPLMLLIAGGMSLAFNPAFSKALWTYVAFIPALFLAFAVRFLFEWTLAQAAFWITRVSAINQVYYVILLFLSGQVAPLALFPYPVRVLADFLPFRYMVGFPVELFLGRLTPEQAFTGMAIQCASVVGGLLMLRFIWQAGVRNYSAVGA